MLFSNFIADVGRTQHTSIITTTTSHKPSTSMHSLTFRVHRYVVIATKPVHRLQILPTVHNYRAPPNIPPFPFIGSVQ